MASVAGPQLFHVCQAWVKPVNSTAGAAGQWANVGVAFGDGVKVGVALGNGIKVDVAVGSAGRVDAG